MMVLARVHSQLRALGVEHGVVPRGKLRSGGESFQFSLPETGDFFTYVELSSGGADRIPSTRPCCLSSCPRAQLDP